MEFRRIFFLCGMLNLTFAFALPWQTSLSIGINQVSGMIKDDGTYGSFRLSFTKQLQHIGPNILGATIGLETGNRMRLDAPNNIVTSLGGLPIQTEIKPIFDALASLDLPLQSTGFLINLKAGAALRQWVFDERCTNYDRTQVNPEIQAGLSTFTFENYQFFIFYRGIYGSNLSYNFDSTNGTLALSGFPTQQGIFIGTSFFFDGSKK